MQFPEGSFIGPKWSEHMFTSNKHPNLISFLAIISEWCHSYQDYLILSGFGVSLQLPHFLICTCSHCFRTQALSLPRTTTSLLDPDFSFILLNTITCLVSLCVILMSPSLKSSVGLVMIGRSTQLSLFLKWRWENIFSSPSDTPFLAFSVPAESIKG